MKKAILFILTITAFSLTRAQTSLSFHHLGNTTFQNTLINASYIPNGKVFFGLPAMSGVHASYNNKLSYNNIFTKVDNSLIVDTHKILGSLQKRNMASVETNINLLHLGYTSASGATLYLFANERINADILYPRELIEFVVKGNAGLVDETMKIGKTQINMTHFREMG
ncbi:MAG: hypothetical protein KI791_17485, partial [Cyclobacteriaceae bacterium]|nr:hypothetical protein [Cyclobacteriaceae bacterium SS2]